PTREQAAIIAAPVEPLLVVAGAGSGKTEAGFAPAAGTGVPTRDTDERGICPLGAGRSRRSGGGARPAPVPPDRGDALRAVPRLPARAGPAAPGDLTAWPGWRTVPLPRAAARPEGVGRARRRAGPGGYAPGLAA
ncbi:hypothetical protein AB0B03_08460, partial [Micromonospora chalcea]